MPRLRRIARWLLLVALGLPALYLAGANLLLASGLLPRLINSPRKTLAVGWGSAWTLVPGRVEVRDFRLRAATGTGVEFEVTLARARVAVDLPALLHRQFHATRVRAAGGATRVRFPFRPGQEPQLARDLATLPEIAGFAPPHIVTGPRPPPRRASHRPPWRVLLEDVRIEDVGEAWVQQFHWRGQARVGGSLDLQPPRGARVGPAWADLSEGRVRLGADGPEVAEHTRGPAQLTLRPFEFGRAGVARRHLEAEANFSSQVPDLAWITYFVPGLALRGAGPLQVHPVFRDGRLVEGSRLDLRSEDAELRALGLLAEGELQVLAQASDQGASAEATLGPARLAVAGDPRARGRLRRLRAALQTGPLDLTRLPLRPSLEVRVEGARTDDFGAWTRALNVPAVNFEQGRATLDGELRAPPGGPGSGRFVLRVDDLDLRVSGLRAAGQLGAELRLRDIDRRAGTADISGSQLALRGRRLGRTARRHGTWWAQARVASGTLAAGPGPPVFTGVVRARGRDARPFIDLLDRKGKLPSLVARRLARPGLQASANLRLVGSDLNAEALQIQAGPTQIIGRLQVHGRSPTGALLVRSGGLTAGLDLTGPQRRLRLRDAEGWYRRQVPPRAPRRR